MKTVQILTICILFSFITYSQTNEDQARSETKTMLARLKISPDLFEKLYTANLIVVERTNGLKNADIPDDEKKKLILTLVEKRDLTFQEILTPEQFLSYKNNVEVPESAATDKIETPEVLANKEIDALKSELKLKESQYKPAYEIILGAYQKNETLKSLNLSAEENEKNLFIGNETKKEMLKDVFTSEQFEAYENYLLKQNKIAEQKKLEKKIIPAETPVAIEGEIIR